MAASTVIIIGQNASMIKQSDNTNIPDTVAMF